MSRDDHRPASPSSDHAAAPSTERPAAWRSERLKELQGSRFSAMPNTTDIVQARPAVERAARAGQLKLVVLLAGQGAGFTDDLRDLLERSPAAERLFAALAEHLDDVVAALPLARRTAFDRAFVDAGRSAEALTTSRWTAPGTLLVQLLQWAALREQGLRVALSAEAVDAFVGHSAGMLAAGCLASVADLDGLDEVAHAAAPWLEAAVHLGLRMEEGAAAPASVSARRSSEEAGLGRPTAMAAVGGMLRAELDKALKRHPDVVISGVHGATDHTVAGTPDALEQLREALVAAEGAHDAAKKKGRAAGRGVAVDWDWIAVATPFHHGCLAAQAQAFADDLASIGLKDGSRPLAVHVVHPSTGTRLHAVADVVDALPAAILTAPLDWPAALAGAGALEALMVDLGPTDTMARVSAKALAGRAPVIVSAAVEGPALLDVHELPRARRRPYADWAPSVASHGQVRHVHNRFVEATGCPPFVLPGMTPTTVEAPIVIAAANAGYVAELAGGGQVTEAMLRARLDEIVDGLEPGRGIVFNALYLDPYLWGLQFAGRGLVPRLKAEGYPIVGVTVSAGTPPKDEALALLDRLHSLGITLNAFKPGTTAQTREVLDIARAHPEPLFIHLEGGRAGGHHSFEDLDDLLIRNYDAIRAVDHAILAVGGGIGTEQKAASYLTGAWSAAYGLVPMPVDGVLLGTRLMATLEAKTSPAVKAALVAAAGEEQAWPLDGQAEGGVRSGRSGLDASIYYLDNAAARTGALLDEVAGDEALVAARREEIVAALANTAKPYFGDLEQMTYADMLRRLVALTAVGAGTVYEDGIWPDATCRGRFEALLIRAQERLADAPEASLLDGAASSDAPETAIDALVALHPTAATRRVHPEDQRFFVEVCRRRGKPVSFVPVIDADVRRWYKSDSLWQSHSPTWAADQVLAIPGPAAVAAIREADEPVAAVLDGFAHHLARQALPELIPSGDGWSGGRVLERGEGTPEALGARLRAAVHGPLALVLSAPNVVDEQGRMHLNPLRSLLRAPPAAQVQVSASERGETSRVALLDDQGEELLTLALDVHGALCATMMVRSGGRRLPLPLSLTLQQGKGGTALLGWEHDRWLEDQRALFGALILDGRPIDAPAPLRWVEEATSLAPGSIEAFKRASDDGAAGVPLNMAFALGWPAIFRALAGAPGDLFKLVHETNTVDQGPAWPPWEGEAVIRRARVVSMEDLQEGRRVGTEAELLVERGGERTLLATVGSQFFIRATIGLNVGEGVALTQRETTLTLSHPGDVAWLRAQPWCRWTGPELAQLPTSVALAATLGQKSALEGLTVWGEGTLSAADGALLAQLVLEETSQPAGTEHPFDALIGLLGQASPARAQAVRVGESTGVSPAEMSAYALASGDLNPLHVDPLIAQLAGFDAPIVHGMWTASWATACAARVAASGAHTRVRRLTARFSAPLSTGQPLAALVERTGVQAGVQQVTARVVAADVGVVDVELEVTPERTAYVFPGQGTHAPQMGMDGYARSAAARAVWDEADAHTQARFGFSLLEVVRDNPRELWVRAERFHHPKGVLYLTQFTQVALAVLAVAQTRELQHEGLLVDDALFGGHSLGEYSALAALGGVLDLPSVVDIVYARGLTMDQLIERDPDGMSAYAMGVVRPHLAGLDEAGALYLVDEVAAAVGEPLEVVNHNIRGRQYTVTGDRRAIEALKDKVGEAWVDVPGVDVPFHSTLLRPGVPAFRERLDAVLPERVDAKRLVGRYLPNLVGRVFALDNAFVDAVAATCPSERVGAWRAALANKGRDDGQLARDMLIELLAWQFASPVRWIETQDVLFGLGAAAPVPHTTVVEIGPGHAPTLAGMARSTLRSTPAPVTVLHAEVDRARLAGDTDVEIDELQVVAADTAPATVSEAPVAPSPVAAVVMQEAPAGSVGSAPAADDADLLESGLFTLLALLTKQPRAQITLDNTIDKLVGGNSARRNQILADLGKELNAKAIDGAHELPLGELLAKLRASATGYRGEGGFLTPQIDQALSRLLGAAGVDRKAALGILEDRGLPPTHAVVVLHEVTLAAKGLGVDVEEARDRGQAQALLEAFATRYAAAHGFSLATSPSGAEGGVVDAAAVQALDASLSAKLEAGGRALAEAFGVPLAQAPALTSAAVDPAVALIRSEVEHGEAYTAVLQTQFDAHKHIAFTSGWAWGRRDLLDLDAALTRGEHVGEGELAAIAGRLDATGRAMALALAERACGERAAILRAVAERAARAHVHGRPYAREVALVTGAGPGSIASAVIAELLSGGARVVATTSSYGAQRLEAMKALYQASAALGAELHVVPCNQGVFGDVDALVSWMGAPQKETASGQERLLKAPMAPTLLVPFAALPEAAALVDMGPRQVAALRVNVLGVERLIARSAELARRFGQQVDVVLPLSPNHGNFGGDGAYGEAKAALEVLLNRAGAEAQAWGNDVRLVGAEIGWVRGTGLMKQNDRVAAVFDEAGLRTFSTEEMASMLLGAWRQARVDDAPTVRVDLSGGLGGVSDLGARLREAHAAIAADDALARRKEELQQKLDAAIGAPTPAAPIVPRPWQRVEAALPTDEELTALPDLSHLDLDEVVLACGLGEVGPYGGSRTRWEVEQGGPLAVEAVAELAWTMGLIVPDGKGEGFVHVDGGAPVTADALAGPLQEQVLAHSGVRLTEPDTVGFDPEALVTMVEVRLDRDFSFPVPSREAAEALLAHAPEHTEVREADGRFVVTRKQGAALRVPSSMRIRRHVTGQVPKGWDPVRLGIPEAFAAQVDPVTLYCLVSTAEAFLSAGLEPEEIYEVVHPGRVGITVGTGIGGMKKLMRLHRDAYDGEERQNDTLQETLINVIGGYVVQAFLGSYGPMSFPVGACATAGLSVADGVDQIRRGRADIVVAGGADDLSEAGLVGFGDMGATVDTHDLAARGIAPKKMSRPSDTRRRGFVEAQGAGVVLLVRGSVALRLGLPVRAVVAFAGSSGDGLQRSVPAPGQGALIMGAGRPDDGFEARKARLAALEAKREALVALLGEEEANATVARARRELAHHPERTDAGVSPLAAALGVLGLVGDDVAVVSKHDSSTLANDENEARLHARLAEALGRTPALPLPVVSQKALTGHPKGAAAAWQMNGLMQMMATGVLPPHPSLDDVSAELAELGPLVPSDRRRDVPRASLKAGLVTTLGFGHVSALVCLAHPFLFWRMLDDAQRETYRSAVQERMAWATWKLQAVVAGQERLVRLRDVRPFGDSEEEAAFLLDPNARLSGGRPSGAAGA